MDELTWTEWFLKGRGNDFFCETDEDFIADRFNITGIGHDIPQFKKAYELICGSYVEQEENDGEMRSIIEKSARHTYGLIHSRFILTSSGLEKMLKKYEQGVFGSCPRVLCKQTKLLPVGTSDIAGVDGVKLFCPHCEDIYNPKSGKYSSIDGAYFGTTFPHIFIQTFPDSCPTTKSKQKYVPRIFGFRIADRYSKENHNESPEYNMMVQ